METEHIIRMIKYNSTHDYIFSRLDTNLRNYILEMLKRLDAADFKEIYDNGTFEFSDLPIPYDVLNSKTNKNISFSNEIRAEFSGLLQKINKEGTNLEYPYVLVGKNGEFSTINAMQAGGKQSCGYDWQKITELVNNLEDGSLVAIFHTHPKAIGEEHKTLFNKQTKVLEELGVKPNGLNLSLADIYACQYLDGIVKKTGKNISVQSVVLMHDGTLVAFSTQNKPQLNLLMNVKENKPEIVK